MPPFVLWVFRSPLRLAGTVVVALALTVGGGMLLARYGTGGGTGSGGSTPVAAVSGTTQYVDAAVAFATTWADQGDLSDEEWHAAVEALATEDLAEGLALTDPATLPGGSPTDGAALTFVSESSALVKVPLSSGSTVLVTVVRSGDSLLVSDVQPDEGD